MTCKVNFRIHSDQWVSNLTDTQILQVCEGPFLLTQLLSKGVWLDEVYVIATPSLHTMLTVPSLHLNQGELFISHCCLFPWQDHLEEDPQTCIPGIGPPVAITTSPDHPGDGVEVPDGEIAHPEEDHVLLMGENETGTGIGKETEVETVKETENGTKIGTLTGTVKGKEGEGVTERLKKGVTGYQYQERRP